MEKDFDEIYENSSIIATKILENTEYFRLCEEVVKTTLK